MRNTAKATLYQLGVPLLIKLYPDSWQERYAEEMLLILEDSPPTFFTFCNLFISLIDAHIHRDLVQKRKLHMVQKIQSNEITIYSATLIFFVAWVILQRSVIAPGSGYTLLPSFSFTPDYPLVGINHLITYVLLFLIALGGLPILLVACWKAIKAGSISALLFCLLGLISPLVTMILILFFSRPMTAQYTIFFGLAVDLALIAFAVQRVAPSRRITNYAFYLAMLIPITMLIGLIVILPGIMPSFSIPGNDAFYIVRKGLMFLILIMSFAYSLIALKNGIQTKRSAQIVVKQEAIM